MGWGTPGGRFRGFLPKCGAVFVQAWDWNGWTAIRGFQVIR